jgi:ubiquitin C-terminal hydrolase
MSVMRSVFSANQLPMRGFVRPHPFWFVRYKDQWEGRPIDDNMTPHGLENGRVNCYRNSAWQALMSVPAFCNWLQRNHGPPLSGNGSKCSEKDCSGCQMYKVFDEIYPDKCHGIHSPDAQIDILMAVDNYFSEIDLGTVQKWEKTWTPLGTIIGKRNRQEDAAEYLNFMQEAVGKRVMHRAK